MAGVNNRVRRCVFNRCVALAAERGLPFIGLAHKMGKELFPPLFRKHGGPFIINMGPLGGWNLAVKEAEDIYDCLSRSNDFEVCVPGTCPSVLVHALYLCVDSCSPCSIHVTSPALLHTESVGRSRGTPYPRRHLLACT